MGHYSLWPMFLTLGVNTPPLSAEAYATTTRTVVDQRLRGANRLSHPVLICTLTEDQGTSLVLMHVAPGSVIQIMQPDINQEITGIG